MRAGENSAGRNLATIGRRSFLAVGGVGAATLVSGVGPFAQPAEARVKFRDYPFSLGVASGDPLPDGVVIWTRLAPEPFALDGHGGMPARKVPVRWEVAADESFRKVVRRGRTFAVPESAHTVHIEVAGLRPGSEYFYRFRAGPHISPVGRTKTAPPYGAQLSNLTFAFASCQAWYEGYYTVYKRMIEDDLDLIVHLGDYIYEYGVGPTGGVRNMTLPGQYQAETFTLAEYRNRYALYRSDQDLQSAHAACPWIVTLDDHEVENNWADEISQVDNEPDQDPQVFLGRRAVAMKAYYEHLPLRRSARPRGPNMQVYRRLTFGNLLEFNVLDTRQYRDDQACDDGLDVGCEERLDPSRSITGDAQEAWLLDGVGKSEAIWNVVAQQVVMSQLDHDPGPKQAFGMDLWDGYAASRNRILSGIVERGVRNPVVLTGDVHRNLAFDIKRDFDAPGSPTIGVEFAGTSVASGGDGQDSDELGRAFIAANPHLAFHNAQRGYVRCRVTPEAWEADYRVLPYVSRPDAVAYTRASFAVEAGQPGLQKVDENAPRGHRYGTAEAPDYLEDRAQQQFLRQYGFR